jgi:predicted transposase YbfD/YdcC
MLLDSILVPTNTSRLFCGHSAGLRSRRSWPQPSPATYLTDERVDLYWGRSLYISSAASNAERLANAIRSHWGIENQVHWVLDVVFADDDSRLRIDHSAHDMAIIRHIVLNMLRQETSLKTSLRQKRLRAGWDDTYALKVLQIDLGGVEQM